MPVVAPLRIGTLGAARITPSALCRPARAVPRAEVVAIAARDRDRAERFARRHRIPRVLPTYEALVEDPDIDAVYVPLPNSHHGLWTVRAVEAGKAVLCEKPFAANAAEARAVAERVGERGAVVMEAFHYRYHPLAEEMRRICHDGALGTVRHVVSTMCIPLPLPRDIRYRYDLAGGALMDVGCYAIHMNRLLAAAEPEVTAVAVRTTRDPRVDRWARVSLRYPNGIRGTVTCALWSATVLRVAVRVIGDDGELAVTNPTAPHLGYRMRLRRGRRWESRRLPGARTSTYVHQLRAFVAAVRDGTPPLTPPADAVANLAVIDAAYEAAGLGVRPGLLDPR